MTEIIRLCRCRPLLAVIFAYVVFFDRQNEAKTTPQKYCCKNNRMTSGTPFVGTEQTTEPLSNRKIRTKQCGKSCRIPGEESLESDKFQLRG